VTATLMTIAWSGRGSIEAPVRRLIGRANMCLFQASSKRFATEFYSLRRPLVPLRDCLEQQFEMVARPGFEPVAHSGPAELGERCIPSPLELTHWTKAPATVLPENAAMKSQRIR
jgi:hypothetical protein